MWNYTDEVMEHFHQPRNQGKIATDECNDGEKVVTGEVGSIACGDALRLHLKIDEESQTIEDAKFQTFGCASAIASSSMLTELLKGKNVDDALAMTNRDIAEALGGLPEEKMHCSVMGQEALEAAIHTYKGIPLDNHEDDEGALICRCFGISDTKVKRIIRENSLETTEQVTNYVKAGGGCGSCLPDIDDLFIDIEREDREREEAEALRAAQELAAANRPKTLTPIQKIALIQQVLEEEIKPILAADGGDVELYNVNGDLIQVILKGACGSCASSTETLKIAIEARLRESISPNLVVEAV
ncbi:MAG: Fe-S cluster assembly protein NifU [Cyanobacteria bacterium P01_E01_bin.42]